MLIISELCQQEVRRVWGNPKAVADAAMNEAFRQGDEEFDLDHDGQVNLARDIGILAGRSTTPDAFLEAFAAINDA